MAKYQAVVTWIDGKFDTYTQTLELNAASEAAALTALQAAVEAEDVLNDTAVQSIELKSIVDFSGWTLDATADVNSDVEIQGLFQFRTATTPRFYKTIMIPGFLENLYATGKTINLGDADVLDFTGAINGGGFATNHYEDLVATNKAVKAFDGKAA